MPIKNLTKLITNPEWRKANPTFEVESDIVEWAKFQATIWLQRWKTRSGTHWTEEEERNNYFGLLGEKCFELTLNQMDISHIFNEPLIEWKPNKPYDFKIPKIETIQVKTVDYPENHIRLMVKCEEYHNEDYVFALKLLDKKPEKIKFMGYATSKEVLETFTYAKNEFPCEKAPCYWQFLNKLHSASDFFNMLKEKTTFEEHH
jgi:hypothetical protein